MNDWAADWDDVLHRAGHSRRRARGAAAIAAVAAVGVILALPGIGVGGGLNAWLSSSRPGLGLRGTLTVPGGRKVGTLSFRAARIFVPGPGKPRLVPAGPTPAVPPRLPPQPARWSLELAPGVSARSAVIETRKGQAIARLCAPCTDGAHGTVLMRPRRLLVVLGRVVAVVETSAGTARGTLRR